MIASLRGTLLYKSDADLVIEAQGVGYRVALPPSDIASLPPVGEEAFVLTYLQVSENGVALYGFVSEEERELFEKLITVSGVGPKGAMAALSTFSPGALIQAIANQDVSTVQKIPGVGKKTASRIILELKGSFDSATLDLFSESPAEPTPQLSSAAEAVTSVLLSMGFTSTEAELALRDAPADSDESGLLSYALKRLGN